MRETIARTGERLRTVRTFVRFVASVLIDVKLCRLKTRIQAISNVVMVLPTAQAEIEYLPLNPDYA